MMESKGMRGDGTEMFCQGRRGENPREEKPRRASAFIEFNILCESANSSAAESLGDSCFLSLSASRAENRGYRATCGSYGFLLGEFDGARGLGKLELQ
jgi:hypothetical protein